MADYNSDNTQSAQTCIYTFKRGMNKGQICGRPTNGSSDYCVTCKKRSGTMQKPVTNGTLIPQAISHRIVEPYFPTFDVNTFIEKLKESPIEIEEKDNFLIVKLPESEISFVTVSASEKSFHRFVEVMNGYKPTKHYRGEPIQIAHNKTIFCFQREGFFETMTHNVLAKITLDVNGTVEMKSKTFEFQMSQTSDYSIDSRLRKEILNYLLN